MRRSHETTEERAEHNTSNTRRRRQRTVERGNNPLAPTWPAPIAQQVKQKCLSQFNKKMSMSSLREQVCAMCDSRYNETDMHNMSLSEIDTALLKPHKQLYGTIPGIPSVRGKGNSFVETTTASSEHGAPR